MATQTPAPTTFSPDDFTTTPYKGGTGEDKAKAAAALLRFLRSGCEERLFTERVYDALYLHSFGHIAHYGRSGFYHTWFATPEARAEWVAYARRGGAWGFHDITRSDLWGDFERAVVAAIRAEGLDDRFEREAVETVERRERAELERLLAKYGDDSGAPDSADDFAEVEPDLGEAAIWPPDCPHCGDTGNDPSTGFEHFDWDHLGCCSCNDPDGPRCCQAVPADGDVSICRNCGHPIRATADDLTPDHDTCLCEHYSHSGPGGVCGEPLTSADSRRNGIGEGCRQHYRK